MEIRPIVIGDTEPLMKIMRAFYDSPAVLTRADDATLRRNIAACVAGNAHLEGYVLSDGNELAGYMMLAISWSTEFGGICVWVEDLCLLPPYRGQGWGKRLLAEAEARHPEAVRFRLEAEADNAHALHVYEKAGYQPLSYVQLTRETASDTALPPT